MQQWINNWSAELAAPAAIDATTMQVAPADAARLADASGAEYYVATLDDLAGEVEIVHIIGANGATGDLTVVRGLEGTAARAWGAASLIEARATRAGLMGLRFDPDTILTAEGQVLVSPDGNVLTT